jgi:hypothetical protein
MSDFNVNIPDHDGVSPAMMAGKPMSMMDGQENYVSYQPVSGQTFNSGQSVSIKVNSDTGYLVPKKSWLSFDLKLVGASVPSTPSTAIWTKLGGSAVIESCTEYISGVMLPVQTHYSPYLNTLYAHAPDTEQKALKVTEYYNSDGTFLSSNSTQVANGVSVQHALRTSIGQSEQAIPLAFLSGGYQLDLLLSDYRSCLVDASSGATDYQITNVRFIACMLTPSAQIMEATRNSLQNNRQMNFPLSVIKNIRTTVSPSILEQHIKINVGYHKSLRKLIGVQTLVSASNTTADQYGPAGVTSNGLDSITYQIGSDLFPKNHVIKAGNFNYMRCLAGTGDVTYPFFNDDSATGNALLQYSWETNDAFSAGIPVADGQVEINALFKTAPAQAFLDLYFQVDALLTVSATDVNFTTSQF